MSKNSTCSSYVELHAGTGNIQERTTKTIQKRVSTVRWMRQIVRKSLNIFSFSLESAKRFSSLKMYGNF